MHFHDLVIILVFNLIVILIFFIVQKRAIAKNIKHLKNEIQELEDLVAAIIEEFEEIAGPQKQIETEIEERGRTRARFDEFDVNSNFQADDLASHTELVHYENDFGKTPFMPEEAMNLVAVAGEGNGLFSAETPEEDVKLSAIEYPSEADPREADPREADPREADPREADPSPGNEFGLFKAAPNQTRKSEGKAEGIVNTEFINDPKHRRIYELWKQGLTIEEIARQLSMGRGEIQLIVGIYRRG